MTLTKERKEQVQTPAGLFNVWFEVTSRDFTFSRDAALAKACGLCRQSFNKYKNKLIKLGIFKKMIDPKTKKLSLISIDSRRYRELMRSQAVTKETTPTVANKRQHLSHPTRHQLSHFETPSIIHNPTSYNPLNNIPEKQNLIVPKKFMTNLLSVLWNEWVKPPFRKVTAITPGRSKAMGELLAQNSQRGYWIEVLKKIENSKFLRGENSSGFVANFDWLLKPDTHVKVMEGNYDSASGDDENQIERVRALIEREMQDGEY